MLQGVLGRKINKRPVVVSGLVVRRCVVLVIGLRKTDDNGVHLTKGFFTQVYSTFRLVSDS